MSPSTLGTALLGAALIHYLILMLWFAAFTVGHDALYRLHTRWFRITTGHFDAIHYAAMAVYKIGVLLFFLVPGIVLKLC